MYAVLQKYFSELKMNNKNDDYFCVTMSNLFVTLIHLIIEKAKLLLITSMNDELINHIKDISSTGNCTIK